MTFLMVMFVLILQFLWKYIDDLVGKGLDIGVILEFMMLAAANLVQMALPLAVLLAAVMTMGNLGEHNELLALKASGISLQRIIAPLFIVELLLSVGGFLFADKVLPYTNLKFTSLLFSVQKQRPELQIKPGVFYNGIQDYTIKVDKRDEKTGLLYNLIIYDHSKQNGNSSITLADSGYLRM
jgi:lipopolysaccharide export system permease protein